MVSIFSADWRNELLRWVADAGNLSTGTIPDARISTTLPADKAYRRGNILGPVSQSGGVPTGALIERGSNANGEYVKFADGTLICKSASISVPDADQAVSNVWNGNQATWTYPAAFVSAIPSVGGGLDVGGRWLFIGHANSLVSCNLSIFSYIQRATGTRPVYALAIGRWF